MANSVDPIKKMNFRFVLTSIHITYTYQEMDIYLILSNISKTKNKYKTRKNKFPKGNKIEKIKWHAYISISDFNAPCILWKYLFIFICIFLRQQKYSTFLEFSC